MWEEPEPDAKYKTGKYFGFDKRGVPAQELEDTKTLGCGDKWKPGMILLPNMSERMFAECRSVAQAVARQVDINGPDNVRWPCFVAYDYVYLFGPAKNKRKLCKDCEAQVDKGHKAATDCGDCEPCIKCAKIRLCDFNKGCRTEVFNNTLFIIIISI